MGKQKEQKNIRFRLSYKLLRRKDLSLEAKVLYAIIHNRIQCSLKNQDRFVDDDGEVFCIITNNEVCELLGCSQPTATKAFKQLEKAKLITRRKLGLNKADRIKLDGINAIE